ncbi:MAG: FkbM family methyltransferase [Actinomycetota bacterium]
MFFLPILKKRGHLERVQVTVLIAGSRKLENQDDYASQGWDIFAPNLTIYGFDADVEACNQANADLEARQVNWIEKHIPLALSNTEGSSTLYITKHPGCSSLYQPSPDYIGRFLGNSKLIELDHTIEIKTTTLDAFCQAAEIQEVDFLQLDLQGAELKVLEGSSQILDNSLLGILTEVEFTEIYSGQPLFGDIDVYLRNRGFTLFDFGKMCRDQRREIPILSQNHPGALIWTDAFYFRDLMHSEVRAELKTPEKLLKLACLADMMEFPDYALEILEYLTLNYGSDPRYNFADDIVEGLGQLPHLVKQGLESLPIIARIRNYMSGDCEESECQIQPLIQEFPISYARSWKETFIYKGKPLSYNRIAVNNVSERAVEIPIAFNFLASLEKKERLLEVGNTLSHYENLLSEYMGIKSRRIVDKFETALGVDNVDLMEIPSQEKYDGIVSVSTVEHIGQGVEPSSGAYGEQIQVRDLEAPLKAVAKIYDLLSVGGKALITVPFGKLTDFGWYIQFNDEYFNLLTSKYKIPKEAISATFLRRVAMEINYNNPYQLWVEVGENTLNEVDYNWPWPCANAIAAIELTKLEETFILDEVQPPTLLNYTTPIYSQPMIREELAEYDFQKILSCLREINVIFSPQWNQREEDLCSEISTVVKAVLTHSDQSYLTVLIDQRGISEEDANLALSSATLNLLMQEELGFNEELEIYLLPHLTDAQWAALLPRISAQLIVNENNQEINQQIGSSIPLLSINSFKNKRAVQLETGAWKLR